MKTKRINYASLKSFTCMEVPELMAPAARERCSSWRRIHNTVTGCNAWFAPSASPVRKAAVPQNRHSSCHLGCSSPAAAPPSCWVTPTPRCWGQPSRSFPRPTGVRLFFTNTGRVRPECLEPLGVSRRKCTATAPIPKIGAWLSNIPQLLSPAKHLYTHLVFTRIVLLNVTYLCELNL